MQPVANVTSGNGWDWQSIDWKTVYRIVKNLRQRIFRASRAGDLKKVRNILARTYKMGKIKRVGKGVYAGA